MPSSRAVTLANLATSDAFTVDNANDRVGIASTAPDATLDIKNTVIIDGNAGVVTAVAFRGDGSGLTGVANTDVIVSSAQTTGRLTVNNDATVSGVTTAGGVILKDGNIVAVGATLSGVLTYEDVTNVDSLGIVTARTGIKVLAGGINAVGVVTATQFKGEGSNVTGVTASNSALLDGIDSTQFLRSDAADSASGKISFFDGVTIGIGESINYGNVQKAFVQEHAVGVGSTNTAGRNAGLGTATGTIIFNAQTSSLQVYHGNDVGWKNATSNFSASGGTQTTDRSGFVVHEFTSPGTFTVSSGNADVEVMVIGGGGSGGGNPGSGANGGGGAGALYFNNAVPVTTGSYTVTVGAGGPGDKTRGDTGEASLFSPSYPAAGGGGGGMRGGAGPSGPGLPGGSGGGGGQSPGGPHPGGTASGAPGGSASANSPSAGWGNPGGTAPSASNGGNNYPAAGGGGASAAAQNAPDQGPGQGSPGGAGLVMAIEGPSQTFAGGGGGGTHQSGPQPSGGAGGGGAGSVENNDATDATANTGSGGGGSGQNGNGGNGGSGKVVIAYEDS
tara:strand:+ start:45 stop:1721 length:1677 start_codon:yes stop_codon:yes gene_type:complete